ncbi:MAG: DNA methyltransferase [Thermoplasmata archaeon]
MSTAGMEKTLSLQVGHERTCDCRDSHMNCLTAKEWTKAQLGVWQFYYEGRDIRDKKKHPAVWPVALPKRLIELFTHQGELVLDPFVGTGTALVAARDLRRNAVGFDLQEEYVRIARSRLAQSTLSMGEEESTHVVLQEDARNIPGYLEEETVALCLTSPPYSNLLNRRRLNKSRRGDLRENEQYLEVEQYSQDERDLGTLDLAEYKTALEEIYGGILPLMKPKGHVVINVADFWWENKRMVAHTQVIEALENAGLELRNIIIWDRTNIVNRIGIIGWPSNYITLGTTFEYLLHFWRAD